jgi:hypothetical protein
MNAISSSSNVPSFDSNYNGSDGGCIPHGPRKPGPIGVPVSDGVEAVSAEAGGTITCGDGTTPKTTIDGQTVSVDCVPGKGGKGKGFKAPILE